MSQVNLQGIDFDKSNIIFVNGLTLEKVKIKYNWLLNANIRDAIIGEDDRGIVWYFGDWLCGEWMDGTWYSGNFYEGVWNDGLWYSYKLEKFDILNEIFFIKQRGSEYSHFHNGLWKNGTFYDGTFGENSGTTWTDYELFYSEYPKYRTQTSTVGGNAIYEEKSVATWLNGVFKKGLFYDGIWVNGQWINGIMKNSKWLNGRWFNGTFNGDEWLTGYWYNGQFIKGVWRYGTFTQFDKDIVSRFGNTTEDTSDFEPNCIWYDGVWKNGEFFSGYREDSDKQPIESNKNYLSIWYDGTWENGKWYGGHFINGTWENGIWYNGIFGTIKATEWVKPEYVSLRQDYVGLGNTWSGQTTISQTNDADSVTSSNTANTYYEWKYYNDIIEVEYLSLNSGLSAITFNQSSETSLTISAYSTVVQPTTNNQLTTSVTYGYDFLDINENNDYKVYIKDINDVISYYNVTAMTSGSSAYTWNVYIDSSDWQSMPEYYEIDTMKLIVKRKVSLDEGGGTGETYWRFIGQKPSTTQGTIFFRGFTNKPAVVYLSPTKPDLTVNDYIWIEQEPGYTNESYNGLTQIIETGYTNGLYEITTRQLYKENSDDAGKMVNYLKLHKNRLWQQGPSITFQDFDFSFDFVENTATTLINGYSIKYDTEIETNNCGDYGFHNSNVWLPWKYLYFTGTNVSTGAYEYNTSWDQGWYSSIYAGVGSLPEISQNNHVSGYVSTKLNKLGGIGEMWDIEGLEQYYPNTDPVTNSNLSSLYGWEQEDYNPKIIANANDRTRFAMSFILSGAIAQKLYLKNVEVKVYYSNDIERPKWYKGTWYKGTWYNGDFYDGLFKSGLSIRGDFYGGNISANYR